MKLIAHRGLHNKKNENTISSFIDAINSDNYVGFECDIRETKDKIFIINHDSYLNNKLIKYNYYKDLIIFNTPTLIDVLCIRTYKMKLIEIKDSNVDVEYLNDLLINYDSENLYVMSFHNHVIDKLHNKKHLYKLGILNYILNDDENYKYDFICLLDNITTKKKIRKYLDMNIEVFIYGILNNKFNYGDKVFYII